MQTRVCSLCVFVTVGVASSSFFSFIVFSLLPSSFVSLLLSRDAAVVSQRRGSATSTCALLTESTSKAAVFRPCSIARPVVSQRRGSTTSTPALLTELTSKAAVFRPCSIARLNSSFSQRFRSAASSPTMIAPLSNALSPSGSPATPTGNDNIAADEESDTTATAETASQGARTVAGVDALDKFTAAGVPEGKAGEGRDEEKGEQAKDEGVRGVKLYLLMLALVRSFRAPSPLQAALTGLFFSLWWKFSSGWTTQSSLLRRRPLRTISQLLPVSLVFLVPSTKQLDVELVFPSFFRRFAVFSEHLLTSFPSHRRRMV
jgi:hypothetical protein